MIFVKRKNILFLLKTVPKSVFYYLRQESRLFLYMKSLAYEVIHVDAFCTKTAYRFVLNFHRFLSLLQENAAGFCKKFCFMRLFTCLLFCKTVLYILGDSKFLAKKTKSWYEQATKNLVQVVKAVADSCISHPSWIVRQGMVQWARNILIHCNRYKLESVLHFSVFV